MALDRIVSLSVALAESPGSVVAIVGSGVSTDAGIPTGAEVLQRGLRNACTRQKLGEADPPNDETLTKWLADNDFEGITYAEQLLELIAPDAATRRDYLGTTFWKVRSQGLRTLRSLELAADGFIKVFVTTNFDRLLEDALRARGIEPVVVASAADLADAVPREHASCYVVKPHGDYLRQTIRNSPHELFLPTLSQR